MEIGSKVQHLDIPKPEFFQRSISGPDIRTVLHRTTAAINNNIGVVRQPGHSMFQHRYPFRFAGRTRKLRTGNMPLTVKKWESHAENDRMLAG